jgi:hypothetical protein
LPIAKFQDVHIAPLGCPQLQEGGILLQARPGVKMIVVIEAISFIYRREATAKS